ncbi:MAG: hypothetical protein KatS3mg114_0336 [Planctomycetaceae bacterium]|nr:MAG: hypothetical protein KatS3mg114_0336 [Planctomycetaceae bacterium]
MELRTASLADGLTSPATSTFSDAPTITVQVRLFARAKELAGGERFELQVPAGSCVREVRRCLLQQVPTLAPLESSLLAAVEQQFAPEHQIVTAGCTVAFFPPVSGG